LVDLISIASPQRSPAPRARQSLGSKG